MSENEQNSENEKENEVQKEIEDEKSEADNTKTKFTFKCTRCDKCCLARGPIPITLWDLELWARNGVVANFLPYLDVYTKPDGGIDLILKPLPPSKKEDEKARSDPFTTVPMEELLEEKCPLYNKEQKKCLIYDNRPLSCRTYPLEFDGKNFSIVDVECPGIGEEGMTKEELKEMRDTAKQMNYELTRMRISLPVLNQIISNNFMRTLMQQQMEAMSKMSDEDRAKLNEIFKKDQSQDQKG
ncbi:MAG: YkgJ family cysteine cluster protein [Promethearchaeota archaeon]